MKKTGRITKVIFNNPANGYTVAIFKTDDGSITLTGCFHSISAEATYEVEGDFVVHKTYGEQFSVRSYREVLPDDSEGIRAYLASGAIKGVGPKTADLIVDAFGDQALEIIEKEPVRLLTIKGIGVKSMAQIVESFAATRDFRKVSMELMDYGIEFNHAVKIFKLYGSEAVNVIKENPYQLIEDIYGINFRKADEIAVRVGFAPDSEFRIRSGIKYVLASQIEAGSTFMLKSVLVDRTVQLLDVTGEQVSDNITGLVFAGELQLDIVDDVSVVYLYGYYLAEQRVAFNLARIQENRTDPLPADVGNLIRDAESSMRIDLSDEQRRAIRTALLSNVCIITGGPGTGKTTIINAIVRAFTRLGMDVALAAPTGRAAKRMAEASGYPAQTVHRLLEYVFSEDRDVMDFGRNEENPLEADAVIVDEASMVDIMLMDGLLKALKSDTRLILVGDADQLPSVGAGNVLRDMIRSEYIQTVRLRDIFRQAEESRIIVNAHMINSGEYPENGTRDDDFFFLHRDTEEEMLETVKELAGGRLAAYYGFLQSDQDVQVLTPTRRGMLGTGNLNAVLQAVLNPPSEDKAERKYGGRTYREGDKVMQIKNNYQATWIDASQTSGTGIFNGDMGVIREIDNDDDRIVVWFDDKRVVYGATDLEELELAYAVTVHKSQGCEFPAVIMPVSSFPPMLMTRNLLYTGVTRGKQLVVLVGRENRMRQMIDNNRIDERNTGLAARLRAYDLGTVNRL
ncbi:MAG: ATP-dependent RecD-like DNA helicase [Mogibacterium sp.]|nr:ATP-dependent RecD-like DNA helicase [Mogibacterium sp.]